MRIKLLETGIQNINQLAKQYHKSIIYFHIDLDGVTSAIAMKEYLKRYGIVTVDAIPIQYGDMEYSVLKPKINDVLPVLVDFAHGKAFMKIHTDHHDSQIKYDSSSKHFAHSKSNAATISSVISVSDIFPQEDIRIINMIDSAGYADEGVSPQEITQAFTNVDYEKSVVENHRKMGMFAGKLLLTYKNKPDFLKTVVLQSNPSLRSMYTTISNIIKQNISQDNKGWFDIQTLQRNSKEYVSNQQQRSIENGTVDTIKELHKGGNTMVGNTIIQVGGGNLRKSGSYDRYTAYRLYPDSEYFIMIWDQIGMLQVSKNPWNPKTKTDGIHLGELVLQDIFKTKYIPLLDKPKYQISLLAIKKSLENRITKEIEDDASGFNAEELYNLFKEVLPNLSDKQTYVMKKYLNMKPSQLSEDSELGNKARNFLSSIKIPLSDIVLKNSGGHPGITNLTGFNFLDEQQRIVRSMDRDKNPYDVYKKTTNTNNQDKEPLKNIDKPIYETTSSKILKSIAQDIVKRLNKE